MSELKQEIKPIYEELQGYLAQCQNENGYIWNSAIWNQIYNCIDQLNQITHNDFNRFKPIIIDDHQNEDHIEYHEYKSKLNALIMNLHGRYFQDDSTPFSGAPNMVISQTQNTQITMIMDVQTLIDKQLFGNNLEPDERSFLEQIKANLSGIKSVADLIALILSTANQSDFDIHKLTKILGF
ncbi:MAG: hypothetical protein ACRDFB_09240 [Rhabdochlamydiaceae bacterium]